METPWAAYERVLKAPGVREAAVFKSQSLSKAFDVPELDIADIALREAKHRIRTEYSKAAVSMPKDTSLAVSEGDIAKLHASVASTVQQALAQYHAQLPQVPHQQLHDHGGAPQDTAAITSLDRAVQALTGQVSALEESCSRANGAVDSRLSTLAGQVGTLGQQVTGQAGLLQEVCQRQEGLQQAIQQASSHITAVQSSVQSLCAQHSAVCHGQEAMQAGVTGLHEQVQALAAAKQQAPALNTHELMLSAAAAGAGGATTVLSEAREELRAATRAVGQEVVQQVKEEMEKIRVTLRPQGTARGAAYALPARSAGADADGEGEGEEDEDDGFPIPPPGQSSVIPLKQERAGGRGPPTTGAAARSHAGPVVAAQADITMSQLLPASSSYSAEGEGGEVEGQQQQGARGAGVLGAGTTFTRSKRRVIETQAEEERWSAFLHHTREQREQGQGQPQPAVDPADIDVTPPQPQEEHDGMRGVGVYGTTTAAGTGKKLIRSGMKAQAATAVPVASRGTHGSGQGKGKGARTAPVPTSTGTTSGRRLRPIERAAESVPQDMECQQEVDYEANSSTSAMGVRVDMGMGMGEGLGLGLVAGAGEAGEESQAVLDPAALAAAARRRQVLLKQLSNSSGFVAPPPLTAALGGGAPVSASTGAGAGAKGSEAGQRALAQVPASRMNAQESSPGVSGIGSTRKAALDAVRRNLVDMPQEVEHGEGMGPPPRPPASLPATKAVALARVVQVLGTPSQPVACTADREEAQHRAAAAAIASIVSESTQGGGQGQADAWAAALADSAATQPSPPAMHRPASGGSAGSGVAEEEGRGGTPLSQGVTVTGKPKHIEPCGDAAAQAMFDALQASTRGKGVAKGGGQAAGGGSASHAHGHGQGQGAHKKKAAASKATGGMAHMARPPPMPVHAKAVGYTGMLPVKAQQAAVPAPAPSRPRAQAQPQAQARGRTPVPHALAAVTGAGGGLRSAAVYEALAAPCRAEAGPPRQSPSASHKGGGSAVAGGAVASLASLFLPSASASQGQGQGGPAGGSAGERQEEDEDEGGRELPRAAGATSVSPPALVRPQSQSLSLSQSHYVSVGQGGGWGVGTSGVHGWGGGVGTSGVHGWGGGGTLMQQETLREEEVEDEPMTAAKKTGGGGESRQHHPAQLAVVPPPVSSRGGGKTGSASVRFAPSVSYHAYASPHDGARGSGAGAGAGAAVVQLGAPHGPAPGRPLVLQGQQQGEGEGEEEDELDIMTSQPSVARGMLAMKGHGSAAASHGTSIPAGGGGAHGGGGRGSVVHRAGRHMGGAQAVLEDLINDE